ncbi:hypothetical protein SAMN05421503_2842 [Terribacillus aidingensis]|uniref:Cysteine-rich CPCC n=1 Tax=Terribacillus aidingensis TaxID=586416 RepID=A0A285P2S4_9BACI|nr:hypothetical protein [Terribacillus aidingensis]SNZ16049.1 hypothetical protein SAMN05421503_2842 [Terribacillus aidingensis]
MNYICPVCGFESLLEPAYNEFDEASYEICLCCQFQFGVDDDVELDNGEFMKREDTLKLYRTKWLKDGARVFDPSDYPEEFQSDGKVKPEALRRQLKNINIVL